MLYEYSSYPTKTDAIPFDEAVKIYEELLKVVKANETDKVLMDMWNELLEASMDYAEIRQRWLLLEVEKRVIKDASRTMNHDVVIVKFDVLSRYMEKNGIDVSWKKSLGNARKRIGDFACFIAYVYGLNAR